MTQEIRRHFHEELQELEQTTQAMGAVTIDIFEKAMKALVEADPELCDEVVADDDGVDTYYLQIEQKILDLFALQTPVASDLRFLTAQLHITLHLERIADMAVNIAKLQRLSTGLPRSTTILQHLEEMGRIALQMLSAAIDAFARRDVELCQKLPEMDDPIDRLNRGMLEESLKIGDDKRLLEWGIRMNVVSRQIERVGDHAVDIGEQVAFLVTGEFREFTDASHPEFRVMGSERDKAE